MIDFNAENESALRLPAAYSQGFAHIRVITSMTNLDDPGPLAVPASRERPVNRVSLTGSPTVQDNDNTELKPVA
jgi:hypothetical protein